MIDPIAIIDDRIKALLEAPGMWTMGSAEALDSLVWMLLTLREELSGHDRSVVSSSMIATRLEVFKGHGPASNVHHLRLKFPEGKSTDEEWIGFYRRWWHRVVEGGPPS